MEASQITSIVEVCTNFGALGVIFWLFVNGKLHSQADYSELREDLEAEKKAHDLTRQALTVASERANSSVLTNQLIIRALYPNAQQDELTAPSQPIGGK